MTDRGKTLSEKIFSRAAGKDARAGEFVSAAIDCAMTHDITGPLAVKGFYEITAGRRDSEKRVWDPEKIVIVFDHQAPADSLNAAENHILLRRFAAEQNLPHFYDVCEGVCHQIMPERGHVVPGRLIVGSDSHTCAYGALGALSTGVGSTDMAAILATGKLWFKVPETIRFSVTGRFKKNVCSKDLILRLIGDTGADGCRYKTAEFDGPLIHDLSVSGRMTISNMAIEMGAKAGLIAPDSITHSYLSGRAASYEPEDGWFSDENASFADDRSADVSDLEPQIACPHNVDNVRPVSDVAGTKIDQIFIGSCTNGRFEDMEAFMKQVGDEPFAGGVRVIVVPASRTEYMKMLRAGFIESLTARGAMVAPPSCGPCMGGSFGRLGAGETGLSTSNRNFRGRQGSPASFVYLCSPQTAGASALTGEITVPEGK